jgi:hypothetical protein
MKFSIGDLVLLRQTGEEGKILSFLKGGLVEVDVNGITFPVHEDELDHPYLKWFTSKKTVSRKSQPEPVPENPVKRPVRLAQGIYLSFHPQFAQDDDDRISLFRLHLLNETASSIRFGYELRTAEGKQEFKLRSTLHAFGNVYLHSISLEDLNEQPRFIWELAPMADLSQPKEGVLRIRPAQLVRFIKNILANNEPSFSLLLANDAESEFAAPVKPTPVTMKGSPALHGKKTLHTQAEEVVDLHLPGGVGKGNILGEQIAFLHRKLEAAWAGGLPQMIVIHGIGDGILRKKVHEILVESEFVDHFSHKWTKSHGMGATRVYFKSTRL